MSCAFVVSWLPRAEALSITTSYDDVAFCYTDLFVVRDEDNVVIRINGLSASVEPRYNEYIVKHMGPYTKKGYIFGTVNNYHQQHNFDHENYIINSVPYSVVFTPVKVRD